MLNPINHTRTDADVQRYEASRTCWPATSTPTRRTPAARGWTWYTGSAGWMYRAGLESILGLKRHGDTFEVDPCVPASWPEFGITWRVGRTRYDIAVTNPQRRCRGIATAELDGVAVDARAMPLVDDGATHQVRLVMGAQAGSEVAA